MLLINDIRADLQEGLLEVIQQEYSGHKKHKKRFIPYLYI